jgi:hypothetical protein
MVIRRRLTGEEARATQALILAALRLVVHAARQTHPHLTDKEAWIMHFYNERAELTRLLPPALYEDLAVCADEFYLHNPQSLRPGQAVIMSPSPHARPVGKPPVGVLTPELIVLAAALEWLPDDVTTFE